MPNFFSFFISFVPIRRRFFPCSHHSFDSLHNKVSKVWISIPKKSIMTQPNSTNPPSSALEFLDFVNQSPSPFHVVESTRQRLLRHGYQPLYEHQPWDGKLKLNGKYFVIRNQSSIVAFHIGGNYQPGNGVTLVAAHTDSPCLKVPFFLFIAFVK
ncbi:hypothetical protein HMI56_002421 [Coelomomyces lativittatus]|nr:hypothetical protein HMI56_002421 [Coelomomyces lativittatus]